MAPSPPSKSPSRTSSYPTALQSPAALQAWGWDTFWVEMRQIVPIFIQMHPDIITVKAMLLNTDSAEQLTVDPTAGFASTKHLLRAESSNPKINSHV